MPTIAEKQENLSRRASGPSVEPIKEPPRIPQEVRYDEESKKAWDKYDAEIIDWWKSLPLGRERIFFSGRTGASTTTGGTSTGGGTSVGLKGDKGAKGDKGDPGVVDERTLQSLKILSLI